MNENIEHSSEEQLSNQTETKAFEPEIDNFTQPINATDSPIAESNHEQPNDNNLQQENITTRVEENDIQDATLDAPSLAISPISKPFLSFRETNVPKRVLKQAQPPAVKPPAVKPKIELTQIDTPQQIQINTPEKIPTDEPKIQKHSLETFDDPKKIQLVYLAFFESMNTLLISDDDITDPLSSGIEWFLFIYSKFPLEGPWNLYIRISVFWVLKELHSKIRKLSIESLLQPILSALEYEPLTEFAYTMMIDVDAWLRLHKGNMLIDSSKDAELSHQEYFILSWEDILEFPFVAPSSTSNLTLGLKNQKTRNDFYCVLIEAMNLFIGRISWAREQSTGKDDIGISSMKKKLEWLMQFVYSNIRKLPPSSSVRMFALDVVTKIILTQDDDPFSMIPDAAKDFKETLLEGFSFIHLILQAQNEQNISRIEAPPRAFLEKKIPYVIEMLQKKDLELKEIGLQKSPSISSNVSERDSGYNMADVIASVDGLYFQIDPIAERISITDDNINQETLVTVAPGKLVFSRKALIFMGIEVHRYKKDGHYNPANLTPAINIKYHTIQRFTTGLLAVPVNKSKTPNIEKNFKHSIKSNGNGNDPVKFFLSIVTQTEVFKFFPLSAEEITELTFIVSELSNLTPYIESEYVNIIFMKNISKARVAVLDELTKEKNPWLKMQTDIVVCVNNLLADNYQFRVKEMERLFHSCRMEPEVVIETVKLLMSIWDTIQAEPAMLKILSILDRILDKSVMRMEDVSFEMLSKWLRALEESVSPYKFPKSTKIIENLNQRAKSMYIDPLTPLSDAQNQNLYDDWEDFKFWLCFYDFNF